MIDAGNLPLGSICFLLEVSGHHYIDVIMTTMASQITSPTVVYSTVYSDADQRKHQSSASLAFVWGIHRDGWIPHTKGHLLGKCFHLMTSSCYIRTQITIWLCVIEESLLEPSIIFFFDALWYLLCWFRKPGVLHSTKELISTWLNSLWPNQSDRHFIDIFSNSFDWIYVLYFHSIVFIPEGAVDRFHCLYIHHYQFTRPKHTGTHTSIYIYIYIYMCI